MNAIDKNEVRKCRHDCSLSEHIKIERRDKPKIIMTNPTQPRAKRADCGLVCPPFRVESATWVMGSHTEGPGILFRWGLAWSTFGMNRRMSRKAKEGHRGVIDLSGEFWADS